MMKAKSADEDEDDDKKKKNKTCACGSTTHQRITSSACQQGEQQHTSQERGIRCVMRSKENVRVEADGGEILAAHCC